MIAGGKNVLKLLNFGRNIYKVCHLQVQRSRILCSHSRRKKCLGRVRKIWRDKFWTLQSMMKTVDFYRLVVVNMRWISNLKMHVNMNFLRACSYAYHTVRFTSKFLDRRFPLWRYPPWRGRVGRERVNAWPLLSSRHTACIYVKA